MLYDSLQDSKWHTEVLEQLEVGSKAVIVRLGAMEQVTKRSLGDTESALNGLKKDVDAVLVSLRSPPSPAIQAKLALPRLRRGAQGCPLDPGSPLDSKSVPICTHV